MGDFTFCGGFTDKMVEQFENMGDFTSRGSLWWRFSSQPCTAGSSVVKFIVTSMSSWWWLWWWWRNDNVLMMMPINHCDGKLPLPTKWYHPSPPWGWRSTVSWTHIQIFTWQISKYLLDKYSNISCTNIHVQCHILTPRTRHSCCYSSSPPPLS